MIHSAQSRSFVLILAACFAAARLSAASVPPPLPLVFEPSLVRTGEFIARHGRETVQLRKAGVSISTSGRLPVELNFEGANPNSIPMGVDRTAGVANYFLGNDPSQWRTDVPQFSRIAYRGLYDGIDAVFYGNCGNLEYDLAVAPRANLSRVQLKFHGAKSVRIESSGDVVAETEEGDVRQHAPRAYQESASGRRAVAVRYVKTGRDSVGLVAGSYDRRRTLIVDPVLAMSTYVGDAYTQGYAITTDVDGNIYIAGVTAATDFPRATFPGSSGTSAAFVLKMDPGATTILWAAYLGGPPTSQDLSSTSVSALAITLDPQRRVYVTGYAQNIGFPTTPIAPQRVSKGGQDAFVARLSATGGLDYSTLLGGSFNEVGTAIAVDSAGNAYISGSTNSPDFPATSGSVRARYMGGNDAFAAKLSPDGSKWLYATFLGGGADDTGSGIAVDAQGYAYVGLTTASGEIPVDGGFQTKIAGAPGFLTSNGGTHWSSLGGAPFTAGVGTWLVPAANPGALYIGTAGQGVFRSMDRGQTWTPMNTGLADPVIRRLIADPTNAQTLFAGTASSLYRSDDGGQHWSVVSVPVAAGSFDVETLAISPKDHNLMYLSFARTSAAQGTLLGFGSSGCSGLYKSQDNGRSWTQERILQGNIDFTTACIGTVLLSSSDATVAYGLMGPGTAGWVIKYNPSAGVWQPAAAGAGFTLIASDPTNINTIYGFSPQYGIQKSTDGSQTYSQLIQGLPYDTATALVVAPGGTTALLGMTQYGVYATSSGGQAWTAVNGDFPNPTVASLGLDPNNSGGYFAGVQYPSDAYVAVLNPEGSALVYSTLLGGPYSDNSQAMALDSLGNVYLSGEAGSVNLPVTSNAAQKTNAGGLDAFVAKIAPNGKLSYLTYLGGSGLDQVAAIAPDNLGNIYFAGTTTSTNFPQVGSLQSGLRGSTDALVGRLDTVNGPLLFSSYFGGAGNESAVGLALNSGGDVLVTGGTSSSDLSTTGGALQSSLKGPADAFVARFSGMGALLVPASSQVNTAVNVGAASFTVPVAVASSGTTLIFTASSDSSWLTASVSGATPATVTLNVNPASLTAGTYHGHVVLATSGSTPVQATITVNLSIVASSSTPLITSVFNSASGGADIAQNAWVAIQGVNLSATTRTWAGSDFVGGQMPQSLDGVSVTIDGKPAFVYYVSPVQVNALVPLDATEGVVTVTVSRNGATSAPFTVRMRRSSPGFFTYAGKYIAATHANGNLIGPSSLYPGTTTPAARNEQIILYADGFGLPSTALANGSATQSGALPVAPTVLFGTVPGTVQFAGVVSPGLYQFNVTVPATAASGDVPVSATLAGFTTQAPAFVTIQ